MAKGISDLGNGLGYIYKVDVDKTTILQAYINNQDNAREIKVEGVKATSSALNQKPYATITVDTITGVGSITEITVNSIDQINKLSPIAYTGATGVEELASLISTAINNYNDDSGNDYTAIVEGAVVTILGSESIGSSNNGMTPAVVTTGNSTYTITDVEGGSDATELYNESYGFTFFINADYDASGCSCGTEATEDSLVNAIEITDYIVPRYLNSALPEEAPTIASGAITLSRSSIITPVFVDTESAAASDDLDTISIQGFADGDIIIIRGKNSGRITTLKDSTGNIVLSGAVDFSTGDRAATITLQIRSNTWYETSRSSQAIGSMSDYRTAGFGFFGVDEFNTQVISDSGTVTYDGGTNDKYQEITGSDTLIGNSEYVLGTAVNGDEFWLEYNASTIVDGNNLVIFGITLSDEQALNGGLIFYGRYVEGSWKSFAFANANRGVAFPHVFTSENIKDGSITASKVEDSLKTELLIIDVSFDANRLGDYKVELPYACTVTEINGWATDTIELTDDADLNFKNDAAVSMGTESLPASTTIGTGFTTITPVSNNVFAAGEVLTITSTKSTPGGNVKCSIKIEKS